jgi:hypothetical protein
MQKLLKTGLSQLLFRSEQLSANIKLTLHKELINPIMIYAYPAQEFAADLRLMK